MPDTLIKLKPFNIMAETEKSNSKEVSHLIGHIHAWLESIDCFWRCRRECCGSKGRGWWRDICMTRKPHEMRSMKRDISIREILQVLFNQKAYSGQFPSHGIDYDCIEPWVYSQGLFLWTSSSIWGRLLHVLYAIDAASITNRDHVCGHESYGCDHDNALYDLWPIDCLI